MMEGTTVDLEKRENRSPGIISSERRSSPRHDTTMFVSSMENMANWHMCRGNVSKTGFFLKGMCHTDHTDVLAGNKLNILFRLPGAGVWLQAIGVIIGCVEENQSFDVRGRFIEFELGDLNVLESWMSFIRGLP